MRDDQEVAFRGANGVFRCLPRLQDAADALRQDINYHVDFEPTLPWRYVLRADGVVVQLNIKIEVTTCADPEVCNRVRADFREQCADRPEFVDFVSRAAQP